MNKLEKFYGIYRLNQVHRKKLDCNYNNRKINKYF